MRLIVNLVNAVVLDGAKVLDVHEQYVEYGQLIDQKQKD